MGERGQGCAQGGPDVSAAAGASGKVCLGGERRGLAGRQQLSRGELVESGALRVLGRSACSETSSPPRSPGVPEARVVERSRTGVGTLGARHWPDLTDSAPRGSCSGSGPQFPGRCGEMEGQNSHIPSACTGCARNPAAGGSLPLAAALYSGKCRGLPERPLRSQVAGGEARREGARAAAGRTDARCTAARPGSVPEPGRWEARVTRSGGALAV